MTRDDKLDKRIEFRLRLFMAVGLITGGASGIVLFTLLLIHFHGG